MSKVAATGAIAWGYTNKCVVGMECTHAPHVTYLTVACLDIIHGVGFEDFSQINLPE